MAELEKTTAPLSSAIQTRATHADSIVALAQASGGNTARSVDLGGVRVNADRVSVATGARYAQQIAELRQAAANASEGASLLDAADAGLAQIKSNLTRMDVLANAAALTDVTRDDGSTYTPTELSAEERAVLNAEFEDLRDEIDSVATTTSFNGTSLLDGDSSSPDDPLELSFQTGGERGDTVTVSLEKSDSEALSSDLASADLSSTANAGTAVTAIDEALDAVADRQAAVRGARAQLNSVETAAGEISAVVDDARAARVTPETAVNLSQVVASQVTEEGSVYLAEGAQKLLQDVLIKLSAGSASSSQASAGNAIEELGGKTSGAPAAASASGSGFTPQTSDDTSAAA